MPGDLSPTETARSPLLALIVLLVVAPVLFRLSSSSAQPLTAPQTTGSTITARRCSAHGQ